MDYIKPAEVVKSMVAAGATKGALPVKDLLVRGFLSGALLGFATSLALSAAGQTGYPIIGALVFSVGFIMIVLLGLELATGSFALLPLAWKERQVSTNTMLANIGWVLLGNLIGSVTYGWLLAISLTMMGQIEPSDVAAKIIAVAEMKTIGYEKFGLAGMVTVFVRAILCNWMVCMGVVMGMTSQSTVGKIAAAWLPILVFFAQGFEHSIVNMFVIPTGMMLGAKVTLYDWWIWNQIPVTLGNAVGGVVFTGLALYLTHAPAPSAKSRVAAAASITTT
jgi:formate/nitrite transporter